MADLRLNELDVNEWRDVTRIVRPDWTDEQFDEAWEQFQQMKARKRLQ